MSQLSRYVPAALGLSCAGVLALAALSASSQTPSGSAYAYPSGAPSAAPVSSASASSSASVAAPKNVLRGADIPAEKSDPPKDKKDWDPAKVVEPNQGTSACTFKLLREWLRVECVPRIGAALVAGEPEDVKVWSWGDPFAALSSEEAKLRGPPPQAVIVLPLRRGDAKIFDLMQLSEGGWDWVGPGSAERISIAWREGSDDPIVVVGGSR